MTDNYKDLLREKIDFDVQAELIAEEKDRQRWMKYDYCHEECGDHNENCPYYDPEEETWDYEECYDDMGGWV